MEPLLSNDEAALKKIAKDGNPESQALAKALLDIADRAPLVVGHSVLTGDLKSFLRKAGAE